MSSMDTIRSAGLIVFRQNKNQEVLFLLLRSRAGFWGFPKGRLKKNEKNKDAAIREAREETGIHSFFIVSGRRFFSAYRVPSGAPKTLVLYVAKTTDTDMIISHEHTAYQWASYADTRELLSFLNAKRLIKTCYDYIRRSESVIIRQEAVYKVTQKIPKGKVVIYQDIARVAGKGVHSRAVGVILGNNYDIHVPCHRVVASDGSVGGYNKGVSEKIKILKKEGIEIGGKGRRKHVMNFKRIRHSFVSV